jgi:hypothetical protein
MVELAKINEYQIKCCEGQFHNWNLLWKHIDKQNAKLDLLVKCCKGNVITNPIGADTPDNTLDYNNTPGQIVTPAPQITIGNIERKVAARKPLKEINYYDYDGLYSSNSGLLDIANKFTIVGDKYLDGHVDLKRYLPYELNISDGEIILLGIIDYRIKMGGGLYPKPEVIFHYRTKNIKTGVVTSFEGGINMWRKWWQIYSSPQKRVAQSSGRSFQRGVID